MSAAEDLRVYLGVVVPGLHGKASLESPRDERLPSRVELDRSDFRNGGRKPPFGPSEQRLVSTTAATPLRARVTHA